MTTQHLGIEETKGTRNTPRLSMMQLYALVKTASKGAFRTTPSRGNHCGKPVSRDRKRPNALLLKHLSQWRRRDGMREEAYLPDSWITLWSEETQQKQPVHQTQCGLGDALYDETLLLPVGSDLSNQHLVEARGIYGEHSHIKGSNIAKGTCSGRS